jgi:subtilase family serine protease
MPKSFRANLFCAAVLFVWGWAVVAMGQGPVNRVVGPIDEGQVVTLLGNVHPLARGEFDEGLANPETQLDRMVLELEPSAEQQAELDALVEAQHDAGSPLFHRWLTPAEYGARFGASGEDVARIAGWLVGHGFQVEEIAASNRLIVFSGTGRQVADTFHTEIHRYQVDGVEHIANAQDPQIPAALAGVVGGVVSLHDFRRTSEIRARTAFHPTDKDLSLHPSEPPRGYPSLAVPHPEGTRRPPESAGAPVGVRPEYSSGSTHYLFPADWATIYDLNPLYSAGTTGAGTSIAIVGRSNINVSDVAAFRTASGLPANNPTVILAGANPGLVKGDQDEATLDVEWSGAVAPAATVKFVVGDSTATTDGVDLSAQYIVNHAAAPVVSTSYGSCEQEMGTAELAFYNSLWEQAASQGMSAFVAAGDAGAAGCNTGSDTSGSGTAVNGLCSSPYSTCVGGTEFNEGPNDAKYWATTNSASEGSALSYIPEEVWNESGLDGGSGLWASGGGASIVYPEPAWQKGVSGTSGGMRAVPDVAMSAAGHDGYVIYENGSYWIISGTSAASPSFAGVMALVVESQGGTGQGNANAGLYPLLNATHNPFHATPSGNNSVPGVTGFTASGGEYNLATGLGSVDGAVLVSSWGAGAGGVTGMQPPTLTLTAASSSVVVAQGASGTVNLRVVTGGSFSGPISLQVGGLPMGVTARWSANPVTPAASASANQVTLTFRVSGMARVGPATITVTARGDGVTAAGQIALQVQTGQGCGWRLRLLPSRCGLPVRAPIK